MASFVSHKIPRTLAITVLIGTFGAAACGSDYDATTKPQADAQPDAGSDGPQDDLDSIVWQPKFEPDYNTLKPHPWVQPLTQTQTDHVDVALDTLVFRSAEHPEVTSWSVGRVVVSAPGEGTGKNPLGFARRVVDVVDDGTLITVTTESIGLEDIVSGDIQMVIDQEKVKNVDVSKLDLEWATKNLYQDYDILALPETDPLRDNDLILYDDNGDPIPGSSPGIKSAFKKAGKAIKKTATKAAKAIVNTAKDVWKAVTPETIGGSTNFNPEFTFDNTDGLFDLNGGFEQTFKNKKYPVTLFLDGSAQVGTKLKFNPGVQVGAKVPFPGHSSKPEAWLNFDSRIQTGIRFNLDLEAGIRSADNSTGAALDERLANDADFAAEVLGEAKERLLGSPDMKPVGGWKRTLFISKPAYQVVMADVVPIVFVETFQLDLECGFEAKASIQAKVEFEQSSTFRFGVRSVNGSATLTQAPQFVTAKRQDLQVLGGGAAQISCGLIPRVNAYIYDMIGVFAGVRTSLVAGAEFRSSCEPDPLKSKPRGDVDLGLKGNFGVQIGARIQAPGASWAGREGQVAGVDLGFEVWQTQFDIYSKSFSVPQGLGYCTPGCRDQAKNFNETDADCGGAQCAACELGKTCKKNTDCRVGYCSGGTCSTSHCGDGVQDGDETGVDCGGSCAKCGTGSECLRGEDCQSGYCNRIYGAIGVCVDDHCVDGVQDGDETGVDCGGARCAKCKTWAMCAVNEDCESGVSNGSFCVASECFNREQDGLESGVDCGGDTTCRRCFAGEGCFMPSDCGPSAESCVRSDPGQDQGVCQAACDNGVKDNDEPDVDCAWYCPKQCALGQACIESYDCEAGLACDDLKICGAP